PTPPRTTTSSTPATTTNSCKTSKPPITSSPNASTPPHHPPQDTVTSDTDGEEPTLPPYVPRNWGRVRKTKKNREQDKIKSVREQQAAAKAAADAPSEDEDDPVAHMLANITILDPGSDTADSDDTQQQHTTSSVTVNTRSVDSY